ncbi:MAG TPA: glycosyltransferase family 9 protein, partial [Gemmatimonadaceae bacterium]|nr:glycosyltransferase family 9 protein [Gemmatimonadaceae bacterium]
RWDEATGPVSGTGGRRLLVNVSAGKASRRWPAESFVEVLRDVRARWPALRILVIGAPDEFERASTIARRAHAGVAETRGLRDALALVATSDVVLTPDTSISHAATAFHKPVVDLLLNGRAQGWGPYGTPAHALESADETLASLPAAPVLAALVDLLGSLEPVTEPEVASPALDPTIPPDGARPERGR